MRYLELYDNTKTYKSPIGEDFTPDVVGMKYAMVNIGLPVVVETDKTHTIFGGYGLLSQYCEQYGINDDELTPQEALAQLEAKMNEPLPEPNPTPEARIAAALEYQNLLNL